jgi:uncharacterized protein YndB with AHSA1/START domain
MTNPSEIATATVLIDATPEQVWAALTEPDQVAGWLHGTDLVTTWQVGSPITWSGTYDGHAYTDRGEVLVVDPPRELSMTHYSPLMGAEDRPENYHTVTYELAVDGTATRLSLTQDGCVDPVQAEQFSGSWQQILEGLKAHVLSRNGS